MAEYIEREALEVALNHRLNFLMAENGETKTIVEWCEQLGANQYTVYYWIREKGITYAERKMSEIA